LQIPREDLTRLQVTPPLLGSPVTMAVNCCVPPDSTDGPFGEMVITIPVIVMVAGADAVGLVMDVAVSVAVRLPAGGVAGPV